MLLSTCVPGICLEGMVMDETDTCITMVILYKTFGESEKSEDFGIAFDPYVTVC